MMLMIDTASIIIAIVPNSGTTCCVATVPVVPFHSELAPGGPTPREVIFSNVLVKDDKPYWLGMGMETPKDGENYSGEWFEEGPPCMQALAKFGVEKKARNEEAAFWAREREKQRELEAADRQAIADFWEAYKKTQQKINDNNRPSNLKFGLL